MNHASVVISKTALKNADAVRKNQVKQTLTYVFLCIVAVIYLYPLLWLIINSLKHTTGIYANPWGFPAKWIWQNYVNAWTSGKTSVYLMNSAIITLSTLVVVLLFASMAAFALTKMKWKLSKAALLYFLIGMMVPVHATLIPLFVFFSNMHLVNTRIGLIIIYSSFGLPAAILVLSGFLFSLPREMLEAAVIDGCSLYNAFWRIVLPMLKPALMTVTILSFVGVWNELLVALVFTNDQMKLTLPVGLTRFSDQYTTDYAPMFAAVIIATIPTIVLFIIFSKRVMDGMAEGAIKG